MITVMAEAHSDDHVIEIEFDVTEYVASLSDEALVVAITGVGTETIREWNVRDGIVEYFSWDTEHPVAKLTDYIEHIPGYEAYFISGLTEWVKENRSSVSIS